MRTVTTGETAQDSFYAETAPETQPFMDDMIKVMLKHKLAIVPTYNSRVSFHDGMRIVPVDEDTLRFIRQAGVCFE